MNNYIKVLAGGLAIKVDSFYGQNNSVSSSIVVGKWMPNAVVFLDNYFIVVHLLLMCCILIKCFIMIIL